MRSYLLILFSALIWGNACQQSAPPPKEASKDKTTLTDTETATIADIEREIRQHILDVTEKEGRFQIQTDSQTLDLQLVRVHTEYLSVLGPDEFFACVDLATENGDVYDVDFFLKGSKNKMEVSQKSLHKLNGKPFYTWKQTEEGSWTTVPVTEASSDLLGVKEGSDHFRFSYRYVLPDWKGKAQLWMPVASDDEYQEIHSIEWDVPFDFEEKREQQFGNTYIYALVEDEYAGDTLQVHYTISRKEKSAYDGTDIEARRYLGSTPFLPVGGFFQDLAMDIIEQKEAKSELAKARALYDYISDSLRYAKEGTYGTADAQYACDAKSGNCTEFHSLFISLARSISIPARFAVGAAIPTERDQGGIDGYHCWAEFYAEGKWWPIDISEANKYAALSTYYFGHHPANRFELSKGRQINLIPNPSDGPASFFAYPIMEKEGNPLAGQTFFDFQRK